MKKILPALMPVLITFGPLAMVIYSGSTTSSSDGRMFFQYVISMAGAVGLAAGLVWMFKTIMRQQQEILKLGQLLASGVPVPVSWTSGRPNHAAFRVSS